MASPLDHQPPAHDVEDHVSSRFSPRIPYGNVSICEQSAIASRRGYADRVEETSRRWPTMKMCTCMALEPCQPDAPLYNSRIIASFLKFTERYYDHIDISELLDYAKMAPYQVEDEDHWFSQEQVDLFHEKLVVLHEESKYCAGSRQGCRVNRLPWGREELRTGFREPREGRVK